MDIQVSNGPVEEDLLPEPDPREDQLGMPAMHRDGVVLNMVIRQDPFSVTLDAWALFVVSVLLIAGMQSLDKLVLEGVILAVPVALLVRNDFRNFLLLGPGGTPRTFLGYLRLSWFRLFALRDVLTAPTPDRTSIPNTGILKELPFRPGPRPIVAGLAPQRQLNQSASPTCIATLIQSLRRLASDKPELLSVASSCIEKHGFALFARRPVNILGRGEVLHIHDAEKSMHMTLHPDDIREVLEKGWGERHPLAFNGWVKAPVPKNFVLIYAPRDESDLTIVCKIIEAAIWYTMAQRISLSLSKSCGRVE